MLDTNSSGVHCPDTYPDTKRLPCNDGDIESMAMFTAPCVHGHVHSVWVCIFLGVLAAFSYNSAWIARFFCPINDIN